MYSIEVIRGLNARAGRVARAKRTRPRRVTRRTKWPPRRIPFLGDACEDLDKVHPRVDRLFVDTSGWGAPHEPALTPDQLRAKLMELVDEHGPLLVALEECGPFQGYLAVWKEQPDGEG